MVQNMLSINTARTERSLLRLAKPKKPTNELTKNKTKQTKQNTYTHIEQLILGHEPLWRGKPLAWIRIWQGI